MSLFARCGVTAHVDERARLSGDFGWGGGGFDHLAAEGKGSLVALGAEKPDLGFS